MRIIKHPKHMADIKPDEYMTRGMVGQFLNVSGTTITYWLRTTKEFPAYKQHGDTHYSPIIFLVKDIVEFGLRKKLMMQTHLLNDGYYREVLAEKPATEKPATEKPATEKPATEKTEAVV